MRTIIFFLFTLTTFYNALYAQNVDTLEIEDLKATSSPAFTILGINPTSIEKPQTPKTLGFTMLNTFKSINVLPKSFAFEVAPHWLFKHPELTFRQYFSNNGIWQNLGISIATTPLDSPLVGTALSFGMRTLIISGNPSNKLKKNMDDLYTLIGDNNEYGLLSQKINSSLNDTVKVKEAKAVVNSLYLSTEENFSKNGVKKLRTKVGELIDKYVKSKNDTIAFFDSVNTKSKFILELQNIRDSLYKGESSKIVDQMRQEDKKRLGFLLEFSGAISGSFKDDSVKLGKFFKAGIWLTPAWCGSWYDILGTIRYLRNFQSEEDKFDTGLRAMISSGSFGFSFEGLLRTQIKVQPKWKYLFNIEYLLEKDIYITGSFGKDFDGTNIPGKGNLITLLGINFGLGKQQSIKIP